jgi:hypothetical protein
MSADEAVEEVILWEPNPGPQTEFLCSDAYEVLYGGAAGGGKTDALLAWLLEDTEVPEYRGLFLRKTYQALAEVIDRTKQLWTKLGGKWNAGTMTWTFPGGATIELGYLEVWKDTERYQGRQWSRIAYDELGQLAEERCWLFLMSRNRSAHPGLFKGMRASANPGGAGHGWIKRRFITICPPDGEPVEFPDPENPAIGLTRAFFAAKVEDNPKLVVNDPLYIARLNLLPETQRKQLREGDWSAGEGLALEELHEQIHIVKPFPVPDYWFQFGSFDWGFQHPFAFGWFAADTEGNIYLRDSVHGRKEQPHGIARRIVESVPVHQLAYIHAGHDVFHEIKARGESTPSIAEQFYPFGLYLTPANVARRFGLNNMRRYTAWRNTVAIPDRLEPNNPLRTRYENGRPKFYIFDTPGNRVVWDCLTSMVSDPADPEDALKRDADGEGKNGDDPYDMVRYGLASRPINATAPEMEPLSAWHPNVLKMEMEYKQALRLKNRQNMPALPLPPDIHEVI